MSKTEIGFEEWRAALDELSQEKIETVPKGWLTVEQFGAKMNYGSAHACRLLRELKIADRVETKKFRIMCGEAIRNVNHYRLKK